MGQSFHGFCPRPRLFVLVNDSELGSLLLEKGTASLGFDGTPPGGGGRARVDGPRHSAPPARWTCGMALTAHVVGRRDCHQFDVGLLRGRTPGGAALRILRRTAATGIGHARTQKRPLLMRGRRPWGSGSSRDARHAARPAANQGGPRGKPGRRRRTEQTSQEATWRRHPDRTVPGRGSPAPA